MNSSFPKYFKFSFCFLLGSLYSATGQSLTLDQAYQAAANQTESLQIKKAQIRQSEQLYKQSRGQLLPELSLNSDHVFRDQLPESSSTVQRSLGNDYQHTARLSLKQPLFSGGAAYYGMDAYDVEIERKKIDLKVAELDLFLDTAETYFRVRLHQIDYLNLKEISQSLKNRIGALQKRAKIGRSKATEVLSARSQLARVDSEIIGVENNWQQAKQDLSNLTNLETVDNLTTTLNVEELQIDPSWQEAWKNQYELKQTQLEIDQQDLLVKVARSNFLPEISLEGDYFFERPGLLNDVKWEALLTISWNLFSGGSDLANMREKSEVKKQAELRQAQLRRQLDTNWQKAKNQFESKKTQYISLKLAVQLAKQSYNQHQREYEQGLVSNLDVLQSLSDYLEVQRALELTHFESQRAWIQLKRSIGEML